MAKGRLLKERDGIAARDVQQHLPGIGDDANVTRVRTRRPVTESRHCRVPVARRPSTVSYDDLPDVLTAREVQAFLRIGRNAIYAALQDGRIRSIRHGQKFLVPKTALREFLNRDGEQPRAGIPVKGTT